MTPSRTPLAPLALHPLHTTPARRPRRRLVAAAAALALLGATAAHALPQDPTPRGGSTRVTQPNPATLLIEQATPSAAIDWRSFSIASGERVSIAQPDARSVLVNRVTGLDPSNILGRLDANGRVFLVNPRGVIFGEGAQVDVGSLVATTLSLGDADVQAGRWWLGRGDASDDAGTIRNAGILRARNGTIALVAPQVENSGQIEAARVALGAVGQARVDLDGDGLVLLNTGPANAAQLEHLGTIRADGGRAQVIAATRGALAGSVLNLRGAVLARALASDGGRIVVDGGSAGTVQVSGVLDASAANGRGGEVQVTGQRVLLEAGARLDASGATGGGRILAGGDWQGANPDVRNAERVIVRAGATLVADATGAHGDGGRIVVWSDESTNYFGQLSARGGRVSGAGGEAEVSGKRFLQFDGGADLRAANGRPGLLLLDPQDIEITDIGTPGDANGNVDFDSPGSVLTLRATGANSVSRLIATTDLRLQATRDIFVTSAVGESGANAPTRSLTLEAGRDILVDADITAVGLTLAANTAFPGTPGSPADGAGAVLIGASVTLDAGSGALAIRNPGSSASHSLEGTLRGSSVSVSGNATLTQGLTVDVTTPGTASVISGNLADGVPSYGITKLGPGTLTLSGDSTIDGGIDVQVGTLRLAAPAGSAAAGSGLLSVAGGATLELAGDQRSGLLMLAGTLAGTGTLEASSAMLDGGSTLAGANLGSGDLLVTSAGTLGGTSAAANVDVSGGALTLASPGRLTGSPVVNVIGTLVLGGDESVGSLNLFGTLAGSGTLTATSYVLVGGGTDAAVALGGGALTSSGSSTLGGTAAVDTVDVVDGSLSLSAAGRLTALPAVTVLSLATLNLAGSEAIAGLAGSGTVALGSGALRLVASGSSRFDGTLQGQGGFTKAGPGTLTLGTVQAYLGATTVEAGTLVLEAADSLFPSALLDVRAGSTLVMAGDETVGVLNLAGTLAGSGTLFATSYSLTGGSTLPGANLGDGPLASSGSSTLGGTSAADTVDVTGGTLTLAAAGRLTAAPAVSVAANSALALTGDETFGTLAGGGDVALGSADLFTGSGGDSTFAGVISGTGTLAKVGSGVFTLSGSNTYTGTTNISGGTLALQGSERLADGGFVLINSAGASLSLGGAERVGSFFSVGSLVGSGTLTAATYTLQGASTGADANLGTGALLSSGASTLGGRADVGSVTVQSGTLALGSARRFVATPAVTVNANATLTLGGDESLGSVAGSGSIGLGSATLTTGLDATSTTFSGAFTGSGGSLVKQGSGTFTLAGSTSHTGLTTVADGTLALGAAERLANASSLAVTGNGTFDLGGFGETVFNVRLDGPGATITNGSLASPNTGFDLREGRTTASAVLGAAPGLVKSGPGTVTLAGANTVGGPIDVDAGRLVLAGSNRLSATAGFTVASAATLELGGDQAASSFSLAGTLAGTGTLTAPAYSLFGGRTEAGADLGSGTLTAFGGGRLAGLVGAGSVVVSSGTLTLDGGSRLTAVPAIDIASGATLAAFGDEAIGALQGAGTLDIGGELRLDLTADNVFDGRITGAGSLLKNGQPGTTLTLTASSDYAGSTTVRRGTLRLRGAGRLPSTTDLVVERAFDPSAALELDGVSQTVASFTGGNLSGNGSLNAGSLNFSGGGMASGVATSGAAFFSDRDGAYTVNGTVGASLVELASGALVQLGSAPNRFSNPNASVAIANGATLTMQADESIGSLTLAGLLQSPNNPAATFAASSGITLEAGADVRARTAGGPLQVLGDARLAADNAAARVQVDGGTLTIAVGGSFSARPQVEVNNGSALALGGSTQAVGGLRLASGTVGGGTIGSDGSRPVPGTPNGDFVLLEGTITASLAGSTGLQKQGSGSVTLAAANGFAGATRVAAGQLIVTNAGALGSAGGNAVAVANAAELRLGSVVLAAPALSLEAGSRLVGTGGAGVAGALTLAGSAVVDTPAAGDTLALAQTLRGGSGPVLTKTGAGTLRLDAAAQPGTTWGGTARVEAGTLALGIANALADGTALQVAGGTLAIGDFADAVGRIELLGGRISGGSGTLSSSSTLDLQAGRVDALLATTAGLDKSGPGEVVITRPVQAATLARVRGGTLRLEGDDRLPAGLPLQVEGAQTLLDIGSGSTAVRSLALVDGRIAGGGTLALAAPSQLTNGRIEAALAGGSAATLEKSGPAASLVTLAGASPGLQAAIDVTGGTLAVAQAQALGSAAGGTAVANGATLRLDGIALDGEALALAGGSTLGATGSAALGAASVATLAGTVAFDAAPGSTLRLASALAEAAPGSGALTKTGSGRVTLAARAGYGGSTRVEAGTLAAEGAERLDARSRLVVAGAGRFELGGDQALAALDLAGTLAGAGTLTAPAYALDGGTTVAGANLGSGTLALGGGSTLGGTAAATTVNVTGAASFGGAGRLLATPALTIASGATLALGGDERVGVFALNGGSLAGIGELLAATASVQGGTISAAIESPTLETRGATTLSGQATASEVTVRDGSLTLAGAERLSNDARVQVEANANLVLNGNEAVARLNLAGGTLGGSGVLQAEQVRLDGGTANADLGTGAVTSAGASRLAGQAAAASLAVESGTLSLAAAERLSARPDVTVAGNATLALAGSEALGRLQGSGTVDLGAAATTTLAAGSRGDATFSGTVAGSGNFTKDGASVLTLEGTLANTGRVTVDAGTLRSTAAERLADAAAVAVSRDARFELGGDERVARLDIAGALAGSGTLSAANYALEDGARIGAALGAGNLTASGRGRIDATAGAETVAVARDGVLTLGAGQRLSDRAAVSIGERGALELGGDQRLAELALNGATLRGTGVLSAAQLRLDGGSVQAVLGDGELRSRGDSRLAAEAGVQRIQVDDGRLVVSGRLAAAPALRVAAGTLRLEGAQRVGSVDADGALELPAALEAERIDARGAVTLGRSITTAGSQRFAGRIVATGDNAAPALRAGRDGDIVAENADNDFGSGALALAGRSARVRDGSAAFHLGRVELGAGDSALVGRGTLRLDDRLSLAGGSLALGTEAAAVRGAAASASSGGPARLPDGNTNGLGGTLVFAADALSQGDAAAVDTAAGSRLLLRASGGGSIALASAGNRFAGGVSAIVDGASSVPSGATAQPFAAGPVGPQSLSGTAGPSLATGGASAASADGRTAASNALATGVASRVELRGDRLLLVPADAGGDAVRADVVVLSAASIETAPGAVVRALLPYGANQGPGGQAPALVIDTRGSKEAGAFGGSTRPIAVAVGTPNLATGIGGLLMDTLPRGSASDGAPQVVFLGCEGCGALPNYLSGGDPLAINVFFNGVPLVAAPPSASAITNTTTLLENARRSLFEAAVRTENAAPRLRAGVIAEVGKGRPATEGAGGARRAETCEAVAGALGCEAVR